MFVPYCPKNCLAVCLTVCLILDARRGGLRAKKKPVRCVAGRAFVLSVGAAALSWVMHSGRLVSLFQSWQGNCRPCGRHPPRCSSPPRGPQPLPMSGSGQSADQACVLNRGAKGNGLISLLFGLFLKVGDSCIHIGDLNGQPPGAVFHAGCVGHTVQ